MITKGGYVYIITNKPHGTLYIGMTNNLVRRIDEHRRKAGSEFAAKYNLTHLVHFESFPDIREAIAREKPLKGWTRDRKIALIEEDNPTWEDLWNTLE
ncbi:MAG: GIY-YIG nuclease family protein [Anaerolineae bacterium]|nr:GIY-YIG nuclease family protein [Anaerolineae bacterium]